MPVQSIFLGLTFSRSGTNDHERKAATMPIGILIKKIQCHDQLSVIYPPRTGPTAGPIINPTPKIAIAVGSFSGGKASAIILCEVDRRPPPPRPCINRQRTRVHKLADRPHMRDENVNITTDRVK